MRLLYVLLLLPFLASVAPAQPKAVAQGGFEIVERWTTEKDLRKQRPQRALRSSDGTLVVDYGTYTIIHPYAGTVFIVGRGWRKNQLILPETYGLYDAAARREVQPCTATELKLHGHCVGVMKDAAGNFALLDLQGKDIAPHRYRSLNDRFAANTWGDAVKEAPLSRVTVAGTGKSGYVDACGKPATPMQYQTTAPFAEGFAAVEREGKYTFIDATGREVVPPKYAYLTRFSSGIAAFASEGEVLGNLVKNGRWGFLNTQGEELSPMRVEEVSAYTQFTVKQGRVGVKYRGQWVELDPRAAASEGGAPSFTAVPLVAYWDADKKRWGYAFQGGEIKQPPQWSRAEDFRGDRAVVAVASKTEWVELQGRKEPADLYGLIDANGTAIIPPRYRSLTPYTEGLFLFAEGPTHPESAWRVGLVDRNGKVVRPATYQAMALPSDGFTLVRMDGRSGYLDAEGKVVIPPQYAYAGGFHQGRAPVSPDGKRWFWIDKNDQPFLADRNFVWISHFVDGQASAWTKYDQAGRYDGRLTIDLNGTVLVTHPLNAPLPPQAVACPTCNGTGSHFEKVEHDYTVTSVDNHNARAPGAKLIITRSGTVTETKRLGECWRCQGTGRIMR